MFKNDVTLKVALERRHTVNEHHWKFIPGISLVYTSALPLLIVTVVSNGAYRFLACSQ